MKILYVTSEAVPFCKTGGLADVAGSLPPALAEQGAEGGGGGLQQGVRVLVVLGVEGRTVLPRADAEERAGAAAQVVAKVLAPAHGSVKGLACAQLQHPTGAAGVVDGGGEHVLDLVFKAQSVFRGQGLGQPEQAVKQALESTGDSQAAEKAKEIVNGMDEGDKEKAVEIIERYADSDTLSDVMEIVGEGVDRESLSEVKEYLQENVSEQDQAELEELYRKYSEGF